MSEKRKTMAELADELLGVYDRAPRATLALWLSLARVRETCLFHGATRMRDLYRAARLDLDYIRGSRDTIAKMYNECAADLARVTAELEAERRRADEAERLADELWASLYRLARATPSFRRELARDGLELCKKSHDAIAAIRARRERKEQDRG